MHDPIWSLIHAERAALAADLAELGDAEFATPSFCAGLTVREVLAHLTAAASLNGWQWLAGVIRCRFDFDKQVRGYPEELRGETAAYVGAVELYRAAGVRGACGGVAGDRGAVGAGGASG